MEKYDVIIIGAGIAGTGLAYNLNKLGYKGSVLVIDKKIGNNAGSGYRNTFKETINEYKLPYIHKYDGMAFCIKDKEETFLKNPFYFIDYKKICTHLIKNSNSLLQCEEAKKVEEAKLTTNKATYQFKYLIDCSGSNFFLKKILKQPLPSIYWFGELKVYKKKTKPSKYFHFIVEKKGFVKDIYVIKNKIIYGKWEYGHIKNLTKKFPKSNFCEKIIKNAKIVEKKKIILPANPSLPLVYKNYAFLGDSFGNATCISGEGIRPILNSSKILAASIKSGSLKSYEKKWKEKYLDDYIRYLALRKNSKNRFKIVRLLKPYPKILLKISRNEGVSIPKKVRKKFSINSKIKQIFNYAYFKAYYKLRFI